MNVDNLNIYKIKRLDKYKKYTHFFNCIYESYFDLLETLPKNIKLEYEEDLICSINEAENLDKEADYLNKFKSYNFLFDNLNAGKINTLTYKAFLEVEQNETIKSILRTFKPVSSYAKKISYNRVANVSGRLVVNSGPNILTLPKRCRSILESRFKRGKILSVDFNALEPRLCLKLNNKDTEGDIYKLINDMLEYDDIDRSVIKRAIISVLYGAHYSSLKNISPEKAKEVFNCIKELFGINKILEISKNIDNIGIRRNYFGRPIWNGREDKDHILINNYIQSSAVDIALTYFTELTKEVNTNLSVPLYILHDAIIFDVSDDYYHNFVNIIKKGYNNSTLGKFPLKIEIFNHIDRGE